MKNNKRYAIIFGIFALVIVTTAASYAFFTYSRVGETNDTITSGDIEFTYKEGANAELANAFPVSDSVGAQDTTKEYTFFVNMKSSSDKVKMNYNVYLVDGNTETGVNYFNNEQIKFALLKDNVYVAGTSSTYGLKLSDIAGFSKGAYKGEGLVLDNQQITSEETHNYKLRIWISNDVNYSNTNPETREDEQVSIGKYNGYKYSLKVKVTSEAIDNNVKSLDIKSISTSNLTITANLEASSGLSAYAVTTTQTVPEEDSKKWIKITDETVKSNIKRINEGIITSKVISYTVSINNTYYLHVKNKNDEVLTESFTIKVDDKSGANAPIIKTGMIPVVYDGLDWVKADVKNEWYNYDQQWWANAVTVSEANRQTYMDADVGTPISMDDINTMWVWVPRYEYETITSTTATEIKVNFLSETESNKTDNYIIHPAFTFGTDELTGIWVAKFEASTNKYCTPHDGTDYIGCDIAELPIFLKPNVTAWRGIRVSTIDLNTRGMNASGNIYGFIKSEIDIHVMKNLEWGAVAYLSQSRYGKYGNPMFEGDNKEIYQNKSSYYKTGMSNGTPSQTERNTQITYDVEETGTGASTTGNIYGIYDMSGGAQEYVMGVMKDNSSNKPMSGTRNNWNSGFSGKLYDSGNYTSFTDRAWPASKYYDLYEFGTTYNDASAWARSKTGDATVETKGWYGDYSYFVNNNSPWFVRGGFQDTNTAGVFTFQVTHGSSLQTGTFRPVLVEQ